MSTLDKLQFNNLLAQLVERGASDLHLSVGSPSILKIADKLMPAGEEILTALKIEELIFPLLTPDQKKVLTQKKSLIFSHTFENGLRFKINLFYQKGVLSASLRFLPPAIRLLKELGLPKQIEKITDLEAGLVIISGPFGSGKTTTLCAIIEHLNLTQELRIVTLEQPIEFIFTNKKSIIQQREIGVDTPSFIQSLDDCLESSLDVVAISQIEQKEELEKILALAEQGHLVLVEMSANSVLETILKLLSFFNQDERQRIQNLLSRLLKAILCQKLIISKKGNLIIVPEILFSTSAVRLSIQDNKLNQINNILRISAREDMISVEQSLAGLVKQGLVSLEEAMKHVEDKQGLKEMVRE